MSDCACPRFRLWYIDQNEPPPIQVCTCGHPDSEHQNRKEACGGEFVTATQPKVDMQEYAVAVVVVATVPGVDERDARARLEGRLKERLRRDAHRFYLLDIGSTRPSAATGRDITIHAVEEINGALARGTLTMGVRHPTLIARQLMVTDEEVEEIRASWKKLREEHRGKTQKEGD